MIDFYQAEGCPYCKKIRQTLTDLGRSYITHNPRTASGTVRNERTHNELIQRGGQDQVPFLIDPNRNVVLYESDAIIEYLTDQYEHPPIPN